MRNRDATLLGAIIVAISGHVVHPANAVSSQTPSSSPAAARGDSEERKHLRDEDQGDRAPTVIDWSVVTPRDRARLRRVRELVS